MVKTVFTGFLFNHSLLQNNPCSEIMDELKTVNK